MMIEAILEIEHFNRAAPEKERQMNDQLAGQIRQLLMAIGSISVTLGLTTQTVVDAKIALAMAIAGPLLMIGGVVWTLIANSKTSIIKSASAMPEVKAITVSDPDLADAAKAANPDTHVTVKP